MYGRNNNNNFRPRGGGAGGGNHRPLQQPPHQPNFAFNQNPNFPFPDPNLQLLQSIAALAFQSQNPNNFAFQNPNPSFQFQNPSLSLQQQQQQQQWGPNFNYHHQQVPPPQQTQVSPSPEKPVLSLHKVDNAVVKAQNQLVASGEHVSAWRVVEGALLDLKIDSWSSLGFAMQEVPSLNRLMITEARINAFIHCFVAVQRITSLFDLEVAICENEGAKQFQELALGPFLRHPLVLHYFPVNSDVTEVFKITSMEIITYLCEFMDTHGKKEIKTDEFLDFIANKRLVMNKEELGIRIQSLGMHISFISEVRRINDSPLKKHLKNSTQISNKKCQKRRLFTTKKQLLDERFNAICERVKTFSAAHPDFRGQHIRFASSSSGDEDSGEDLPVQNVNGSNRVSSCRYPSAGEEIARLGLKGEMDDHLSPASGRSSHNESPAQNISSSNRLSNCPYPSVREEITRLGRSSQSVSSGSLKKKRKRETLTNSDSGSTKLPKEEGMKQNVCSYENGSDTKKVSNLNEADISLSDDAMRMFITTWKEACMQHDVPEVLERMLQFYEPKDSRKAYRQRKRVNLLVSSYPFVGLLNVAVTSIKCGMWDSIYDTIQAISQHGLVNTPPHTHSKYESIDVEPSGKDVPTIAAPQPTSVTVEEVVSKVRMYFELDQGTQNDSKSHIEKNYDILRKLYSCECWLAEQFFVKEFNCLGYGEFFLFLEKHASLLPIELQKFVAGDVCEKASLEACLIEHLLMSLVSQASNSLWDREKITKQMISRLLMRQFPSLSFRIVENGSTENFLDTVRTYKNNATSKCVLFSATLLGTSCIEERLSHEGNCLPLTTMVRTDTGQETRVFESVASKDAIEILHRAPMLSDLNSWSHWDLLFAPSLGPLIGWLLNNVNEKELLCLVTKDGKVIRIDHSANVDSFLEAVLQGSAFQTAVKLLSLFSLAGGEKHVPLSLLKCHARHAFEVILKNHLDNSDVNYGRDSLVCREAFCRQNIPNDAAPDIFSDGLQNLISLNKALPVATRFVLNCLGYLPSEFRGFAADVLLSGMRSVMKDAPSAILCDCKQTEERFMLHEIGLTLGIVEWIDDYHAFCSTTTTTSHDAFFLEATGSEVVSDPRNIQNAFDKFSCTEGDANIPVKADRLIEEVTEVCHAIDGSEVSSNGKGTGCATEINEVDENLNASLVIESIRRDEFGLDPNLSDMESSMLKKQHARLGRALHCLSQELYSQDSHFLLELVQNADDNIYPENVEPTLTFILQESRIIVLNNEQGFSAQNMRALCDVGSSTKKGSGAGYIGQKGIGFKSVFRVTDAPQIHSNGFHVKFDISEGQIGFVLPTTVPPCDIELFNRMASRDTNQLGRKYWSTCIVLPFRSKLLEGNALGSILKMFSDLHPSLLLFLHRLQRIIFRNMIDDSHIVMRKEILGDGIIKVSCGKDKMTWLVSSQKLQADVIHQKLRTDVIRCCVETTEVAVAFTLQELDKGDYTPQLVQQPVFAFLPLRTYGLKFILQGDFVLPSSREEVDGDSPWNQWLLTKIPSLFVDAERSFCSLPCFREAPGKAVAAYMSFVPLVGEVHGFFASLPHTIISKLRMSNCLLLEGELNQWVPPCKVLRGWNKQARLLLPDGLLHKHLGLGFLDKDIILTDSLARALGVVEYGPNILVQFMSSLCCTQNGVKLMGLKWLSSWVNTLYTMLVHTSGQALQYAGVETDLIETLLKIPFIPLLDGTYSSVEEGTIWLHSEAASTVFDTSHGLGAFPQLCAKLRIVNPSLLSASADDVSYLNQNTADNITRMLHRIGVQHLSGHDIIKAHILPAISDDRVTIENKNLMADYLCFVMIHLELSCPDCCVEREYIILELRSKALILTNHGFKRPFEIPIHFSKEFGNPIDANKLINVLDVTWLEVDITYLRHPATESLSCGLMKWRKFLQEIGITDFVAVVQVEKSLADIFESISDNVMLDRDLISPGLVARDWESHELVHLLSTMSMSGDRESCKYLLEVLDSLWDACFSDKATGYCNFRSSGDNRTFKSSFVRSISDVQWVASSMDDKLHYPKDLFHDCHAVRLILGASAPYAVPTLRSEKLLSDIGFKTQVSFDDVLEILKVWRSLEPPFKTSMAQMTKFYSYISDEITTSKPKIIKEFHSGPAIFVPYASSARHEDVVSGKFLSPEELYWFDSTRSEEKIREIHSQGSAIDVKQCHLSKTLCDIYPGLHDFFVNECGVQEAPSYCSYLKILQQLSSVALPSQAANTVFQVFLKWAEELKSGLLNSEDIIHLKECLTKLEYTVLPTVQDRWVSLHTSFGLVCWCDDSKLGKRFKSLDNVDFLCFGNLSDCEQGMLQTKVSILLKTLGIPALSEVVTREAIYSDPVDGSSKASLVNWALPYAQRYMRSMHPDKYIKLKESEFDNLNNLQIIVVEKLQYQNVIKNYGIVSKKLCESSCLLQGNILYSTRKSSSHALFMELSSLFFDGIPDLHLANFLHMIKTMLESGATKEQTEFFILNSQKVSKLPDAESLWFLSSISSLVGNEPGSTEEQNQTVIPLENDDAFKENIVTEDNNNEQNPLMCKRKTETYSSWPPSDWKNASGFNFSCAGVSKKQATQVSSIVEKKKEDGTKGNDIKGDDNVNPIEIDAILTAEDNSLATSTAVMLPDSIILKGRFGQSGSHKSGQATNHADSSMNVLFDPVNLSLVSDGPEADSSTFNFRDQLNTGAPNPNQALLTGRLGEHVAFKYFSENLAKTNVRWVNEDNETGLPYDIVIGEMEGSQEYIEVKATKSARKDWFKITMREWQFANEKGDSFSVAHVVLGNNAARVSVYKNPVKLCYQGKLQLVVMMPREHEFNVVS